jgi:hypothetical protein
MGNLVQPIATFGLTGADTVCAVCMMPINRKHCAISPWSVECLCKPCAEWVHNALIEIRHEDAWERFIRYPTQQTNKRGWLEDCAKYGQSC